MYCIECGNKMLGAVLEGFVCDCGNTVAYPMKIILKKMFSEVTTMKLRIISLEEQLG